MVCRENPTSSIAIALARTGTWLDDSQVQSIVHRLRHEYASDQPPPGYDRDTFLIRQLDRSDADIENNPVFRSERRAGLRNRLARAREETVGLRDDILWALSRLPDGVHTSQAALETRLGELAGQRGMSLREARAEFLQLRAQAPAGRQRRANAVEQRDLGAIPGDPATRYALTTMAERESVLPPVRLVQQWIPLRSASADHDVQAVGISSLSDRVEIRRHDGSTAAYQVDRPAIDAFLQAHRATPATQDVAGTLERAGTRIGRAEQTAYATRCDECGQFVGNRWHDCPDRGPRALVAQTDAVDQRSGVRLRVPDPDQLAALVGQNHDRPVQCPVSFTSSEAHVVGEVLVRPGLSAVRGLDRTTRQRIDVDDTAPGELTCQACHADDCRHIAQAREAVRDHLQAAGALEQAEVSAALDGLGVRVTPRTRTPEEPAASTGPATSFLSNPEAFRQAILDTGTDRVVPFHTESALQGYAADTQFGVEIEFNSTDHRTTAAIARELAHQGILPSASQQGYHAASRTGYRGWTYERDGSVYAGGELVTPIMSDTPQAWAEIQTVCNTIRRLGGTTDAAGSHTNISSAGYTPAMAWRLVHLIRAHEDDIFRMGRTRGSQREAGYNAPFPQDPGPEWTEAHQPRAAQRQRETMINFYQTFSPNGRIEFRFPDASHDPGVTQAQVNLCAAMTNYVRDHDVPTGQHQPLHSARQGGWARNLMASSVEQFESRTVGVRRLIDTLFTSDRDRLQIAALWGHGSYFR